MATERDGSDGSVGRRSPTGRETQEADERTIEDVLEAGEWTVVHGPDAADGLGEGSDSETASDRDAGAESDRRGQRLYDWWSRRSWLYDAVIGMAAPLREEAFEALAAREGEAVLDLGCGPGTNFERLRADVGPAGAVIGLDYSSEMVERAARLVAEKGSAGAGEGAGNSEAADWSNVGVVRADATRTCGPPEAFDAAFTTFALHTMADVDAVVGNVHEALRPGGRFVVSDAREIRDWPASLLNPIYERIIARTVNHRPDQDPLGALESTFASVEVVNTYDAGSGYLAVARKSDSADERRPPADE